MYAETDTAEEIIPDLVEILNSNKSLLFAIKQATKMFTVDDWKKMNAFIESLGE